jgi:hypothetical protein
VIASNPAAEITTAVSGATRTFCMVLFPHYLAERVEKVLDEICVPGYSHGPDLVGRGTHGPQFNTPVWPGATGQIFTVVDDAYVPRLVQALRALDAALKSESHGLYSLHVLTWPCTSVL